MSCQGNSLLPRKSLRDGEEPSGCGLFRQGEMVDHPFTDYIGRGVVMTVKKDVSAGAPVNGLVMRQGR